MLFRSICPSVHVDYKWKKVIEHKAIPMQNIYDVYDDERLNELVDGIQERFERQIQNGLEPEHTLIVMDDCSFSGSLKSKMHGVVDRLFCNARHVLISTIVTAQKYTDIPKTARLNATGTFISQDCCGDRTHYTECGARYNFRDWREITAAATYRPYSWFVTMPRKGMYTITPVRETPDSPYAWYRLKEPELLSKPK